MPTDTQNTTSGSKSGFTPSKFIDGVGGFNSMFSLVSLGIDIVEALASDDPGEALLGILGIDIGTEPEYRLEDLRLELFDKIEDEVGNTIMAHIADATATTATARDAISTFLEDPSEARTETIIHTANDALNKAIAQAEAALSAASNPHAISAAIMAVTEALAVRMAVVEAAQDGAWGKETVQQQIEKAVAFFDNAKSVYGGLKQDYIDSNPVKVESVSSGSPNRSAFKAKAEGLTAQDFRDVAADMGMHIKYDGSKFVAAGNNNGDSPYLKVYYASGFGNYLVEEGVIPEAKSHYTHSAWLKRTTSDHRDHIKKYIDKALTEKMIEKEGFALDESEIGVLAKQYQGLIDGESFVGVAGNDDFVRGTSGKDFISGLDYHDQLYGLDGRDVIKGGTGRDVLDGGAGSDVLFGGEDNDVDRFVFRDPEDVDRIKQFKAEDSNGAAQDKIMIDVSEFVAEATGVAGLNFSYPVMIKHAMEAQMTGMYQAQLAQAKALQEESSFFVVGEENVTEHTRLYQDGGKLYWDIDGGGGYEAVHFATLEGAGDLTVDNFDFF